MVGTARTSGEVHSECKALVACTLHSPAFSSIWVRSCLFLCFCAIKEGKGLGRAIWNSFVWNSVLEGLDWTESSRCFLSPLQAQSPFNIFAIEAVKGACCFLPSPPFHYTVLLLSQTLASLTPTKLAYGLVLVPLAACETHWNHSD